MDPASSATTETNTYVEESIDPSRVLTFPIFSRELTSAFKSCSLFNSSYGEKNGTISNSSRPVNAPTGFGLPALGLHPTKLTRVRNTRNVRTYFSGLSQNAQSVM